MVGFAIPIVKYIRHYVKHTIQSGAYYRTTREVQNVNEMTGVPLPRTPEKDDAGIVVHGIPVIGPPSGETDFRSR
jgi:hypothetical protein